MERESGEIDDLAAGLDSLDQAEADDDPGCGQTTHQVRLEASQVVPGGVLLQTEHRPLEVILAGEDPGVDLQYLLVRVVVKEW